MTANDFSSIQVKTSIHSYLYIVQYLHYLNFTAYSLLRAPLQYQLRTFSTMSLLLNGKCSALAPHIANWLSFVHDNFHLF